MTTPSNDPVLHYRPGRIAQVVFNRPHVKNALSSESWELFDQALRAFETDDDARVLVISGAGDSFSAGADISGKINAPSEVVRARMEGIADIVIRLHTLPKPVIAKVDGAAVGVGMSLALGCDLVIASDRARFGAVFAKLGLCPDGGLSRILPQLVGVHKAKELLLFARIIEADEALRLGLVNTVVPVAELDEVTQQWSEHIASVPPKAAEGALRLVDAAWTTTLPEALAAEAIAQEAAVAAVRAARE